jgi:hypothetical protein
MPIDPAKAAAWRKKWYRDYATRWVEVRGKLYPRQWNVEKCVVCKRPSEQSPCLRCEKEDAGE